MTKDEATKILNLLSTFYPNAKQPKSKAVVAAWKLVLVRFPYQDAKEQVIRYAAFNKFFPDVCDITGNLTPEPGAFQEPPPSPEEIARNERMWKDLERLSADAKRRKTT